MKRHELDRSNCKFWDELCGSHTARHLGINDYGLKSLSKFDNWYFSYYSYLLEYIQREKPFGKKVLEVGLGYGSLGQRLAKEGANYLGLDIASGPVGLMQHRLAQTGLSGDAEQCNFLENNLPDASFDLVVSIGCFHHVGNLSDCIEETFRLLKKGGTALMMVYNRHSYRHFFEHPLSTLLSAFRDRLGRDPVPGNESNAFLCRYDANEGGHSAPFSEFSGIGQVHRMCRFFRSIRVWKENCSDERLFGCWFQRDTLRPLFGRLAGTDLYIRAVK